jgi:hypothetical protein
MDDDADREERTVYAIIALAVAPVIVAVAIQGGVIDGGTTLCLVVAVLGAVGAIDRRSAPVPHARVHRATPRNDRR